MGINNSIVLTGYAAITARGDYSARGKSTFASAAGGIIENFDLHNYPVSKKTYLDRCSALALAGTALALHDAGIAHPPKNAARFGITLGTHYGCIDTMKSFWDNLSEKGARFANPLLFSHSYFNSPISLCAIEFGLQGYHNTICSKENSALEAIRLAHNAITAGHADAMLCGGVDAWTSARQQLDPTSSPNEASVFFVLEKSTFAQARDANIISKIDSEKLFTSSTDIPYFSDVLQGSGVIV